MTYKSVEEVVKKQELVGKTLPLQIVRRISLAANASTTITLEAPLQERWIVDEIVVGTTAAGIVLDRILMYPDNVPYPLDYPIELDVLEGLAVSGDNRIVFEPPIVIDKGERREKIEITFRNTTTSTGSFDIVIKGIKLLKK